MPEDWKWVELKEVAEIIMGQSPKGTDTTDNNNYMPLIGGAADMRKDGFNITRYTKKPTKVSQKNDIILCIRATLGNPVISDGSYCLGRGVAAIRVNQTNLNIHYLKYFFIFNESYLYNHATGSTFLQVTGKTLKGMKIYLPSLQIQQKIADLIDREFARLDEAKDKITSALDGAEARKQAILHKAFTGELTAKWREENKLDFNWEHKPLKDVCNKLEYGTSSKSKKEGLIPVIRMGNIQNGEIDWNNLVYSNNREDNQKYKLKIGDVLFNRTNSPELVGKTAIYRGEQPAIYAGYLIRLNYKKEIINSYFLNYMMNTPEEKNYCASVKTDGVNQSNVNAKKIGQFIIPVPALTEQQKIVNLLDAYEVKNQALTEKLEATLTQIDTLKKAILSKAFRGELIQ